MWKLMHQSNDAANPDHRQAELENNRNANCQVVYVVKSPTSECATQIAPSPYLQGDRRRTSSDEGFADDPLTDDDGTWLWPARNKAANQQKRRRWLRQAIGVVAAAVALILTAVVLVICFRLVTITHHQQSSAALEVSITDLSLVDLLKSESEIEANLTVSTAFPSTAKVNVDQLKPVKISEVAQLPETSSLVASVTTSITTTASIRTTARTVPVKVTTVPLQVNISPTNTTLQSESKAAQCNSSQFYCPEGIVRHRYVPAEGDCISSQRICDGTIDCVRGTDESNCTCRAHEFRCRAGVDRWRGSQCVPRTSVCDRVADCLDDSDEQQNCSFACPAGQFICAAGRAYTPRRVSSDRTLQSYCVRWAQLCDGTPDCEDGSDELACSDTCPPGMARCINGTTQVESLKPTSCLRRLYWCDRLPHCSDGSDEKDCIYRCPWGKFACATGEPMTSSRSVSAIGRGCLFNKQRCDGIVNCRDGSDEDEC